MRIITAGALVAAADLAGQHKNIYATAGVHPHDAKDVVDDYLDQLTMLAEMPKNVAVGEIGLDYHYDFSPRENQRRIFAEQLQLARRLGKKVVIHTREAFADTMAILAESEIDGRTVVFHSFTGGCDQTQTVLDIGAMVSFSGIVSFARAGELRQSAKLTPPDRILIETDSPFLSPEPVRKMKTNEPANVAHVAAAVAAARDEPIEHVAEITTANAVNFFQLNVE